jgi:hypothetical protein
MAHVPSKVNGLGLSGPPKAVLEWTHVLYMAVLAASLTISKKDKELFTQTFSAVFAHRTTASPSTDPSQEEQEQHPDLKSSHAWGSDVNRYILMKELDDKIFHKNKRKQHSGSSSSSSSGGSGGSGGSNNNSSGSNKRTRVADDGSAAAASLVYTQLTETASTYQEPTAMISLDVFTCTMKNIKDHVDTSITGVTSRRKNRGVVKFEQLDNKIQLK